MRHFYCFSLTVIALLLMSCTGQKTAEVPETSEEGTQTYCYKDSCQHLTVSISFEVPVGSDSVSMLIRDSLIADLVRNTAYDQEGNLGTKPYGGDMSDIQAIVDYYGKANYDRLLAMAMDDYGQRMEFLEEDTTMEAEERERIKNDVPMWAYELTISRSADTDNFVVYNSQTYCYYGGAHGGVGGSGSMTFSKQSGNKIERFIMADAAKDMQPLIRKGLVQYFSDGGESVSDATLNDQLQIESKIIPLPQQAAFPNATGDSLTFIYGQYEIACYAAGMPSFTLPVSDVKAYLTPEGKACLNVK